MAPVSSEFFYNLATVPNTPLPSYASKMRDMLVHKFIRCPNATDRSVFRVCAVLVPRPAFRWENEQQFLEREIDRLFALGVATPEAVLDFDSFRVVVHALDPFEFESSIATMFREADIHGDLKSSLILSRNVLCWSVKVCIRVFVHMNFDNAPMQFPL